MAGLGKQAKILSETQQRAVVAYLADKRHPERNIAMFLLSVDAGLRAKELAELEWSMLTDSEGNIADAIRLENRASKGRSGGVVYLSTRLEAALERLRDSQRVSGGNVIRSQCRASMSIQGVTNWFLQLYKELGFEGCSSHSGRRTAITRWARNISSVGGSLRDVQSLARHSSISMTQRYIEVSEDACKRVVG